MTVLLLTFFALSGFAIALLVFRANGRCSVQAHGQRALPAFALLWVLSWFEGLGRDGNIAYFWAGAAALLFGYGMLFFPQEEPQLERLLGRLAGTAWQIALGFCAVLGAGLWMFVACLFAIKVLILISTIAEALSIALMVHGFRRRARVKAELRSTSEAFMEPQPF